MRRPPGALRPGLILLAATLTAACDSTDELFPPNGTLRLSVVDTGLVTQASATPGNQIMTWTVEAAVAEVNGQPFEFLTTPGCEHRQLSPRTLLTLSCSGAVRGYVFPSDLPLSCRVRLTVSRMDLRRADRPQLPPDGDFDGDGVLNDGDASGTVGDEPCPDGVTADCDDNCVLVANADQEDGNGDGFGDACSLLDGNDEPTIPDRDVDGKADVLDNCLWIANFDQTDAEPDGIGDACERIASIDLGGTGEIDLGPVDVTLGDGTQKFLSLDFDDRVAVVDCDAAFTSCRLDPSMVLLTVP